MSACLWARAQTWTSVLSLSIMIGSLYQQLNSHSLFMQPNPAAQQMAAGVVGLGAGTRNSMYQPSAALSSAID